MNKHWLSIAALCLLLLPVDLRAQFTFVTNADNTITITGYTGTSLNVSIPGKINGHFVTIIGDSAFSYSSLTNVTISTNITSIGNYAFWNCPGLLSVIIPGGVTNIGNDPFGYSVGLTNITVNSTNMSYASSNGVLFNKSMTTLVQYPSGLTGSYTIPDSVTNIAGYAFDECFRLPSVTISANVIAIGTAPFIDCYALTNIVVDTANPSYTSTNGVLFSKTMSVLIDYPCGLTGSYVIPNGVFNIADSAFLDCSNLTAVVIADSATNIGPNAFFNCSGVTNAEIGSSVTYIDQQAFYGCSSLTSLTIPNSVSTLGVGGNTFASCSSLKNVVIPNSLSTLPQWAFYGCGLTNVTIPNSVSSIDYGAFESCPNLVNVTITASLTNIGLYAFAWCEALRQVYFPGNAPSVNGAAGSADNTVFLSVFQQEHGLCTVYYLPGTTGWGATFGSWPTALWNPQIQTTNSNFGIRTNQFGFNLTGTTNIPIVVEATTNLSGVWTPLLSGTITNGSIYFADSQWANYPQRFYRVRSP